MRSPGPSRSFEVFRSAHALVAELGDDLDAVRRRVTGDRLALPQEPVAIDPSIAETRRCASAFVIEISLEYHSM
jgi:hypothetical protein